MAKISPRTTWRLAKALRGKRSKPSRNDGVAVVTQVDRDGTRWVRMPGASMDTPVNGEMVANAAVGESVSYRVEDGRLSITGNASDPAMGVAAVNATVSPVAEAVESVRGDVSEARSENETTMRVASEARDVANATNQNFWTDTDGVHVTEVTQDDWKDSEGASYHSGPNMLINSVGQLLRNGLNNLVSITFSAIAFYDGLGNAASNIVARFGGDGIRIGRSTESNVQVDYHSMRMVDKEGHDYFYVSDLRDRDGYYEITEHFTGDGSTVSFQLSTKLHEWGYSSGVPVLVAAYVDDVETEASISSSLILGYLVDFSTAPADGSDVKVVYKSDSRNLKAYTLGLRDPDGDIGVMSLASGLGTTASGLASHAEGHGSAAIGDSSHAEGHSTASGDYSHAEGSGTASGSGSHAEGGTASGEGSHTEGTKTQAIGDYSHAEGEYTRSRGRGGHAEGYGSSAWGDYSHAEGASSAWGARSHSQNNHTIAAADDQTAIGRYNVEDANGDYALIIGNGTGQMVPDPDNPQTQIEDRSNAFTVDWDGIMSAGLKSDTIDINTSTIRSTNTNEIHSNGVCCSVTLNVRNNAAIANGSNIVIGTVPEGFRPPQTIYSACSANNAAGMGCYMTLGTGGAITCYNRSGSSVAANTALAATFTYAL